MREDTPELLFPAREDFRKWLSENSEFSSGVWLVFGKDKTLLTLSAREALEEALCYGWIDGLMKRVDDSKYIKYFAKRWINSPWSQKNKAMAESLLEKGLMTVFGKNAILTAKKNGTWDVREHKAVTDEDIEAFSEKLSGISPAYENFLNMTKSVKRTYTKRYHSFKTEEARERDFNKIIERLNDNLRPM